MLPQVKSWSLEKNEETQPPNKLRADLQLQVHVEEIIS